MYFYRKDYYEWASAREREGQWVGELRWIMLGTTIFKLTKPRSLFQVKPKPIMPHPDSHMIRCLWHHLGSQGWRYKVEYNQHTDDTSFQIIRWPYWAPHTDVKQEARIQSPEPYKAEGIGWTSSQHWLEPTTEKGRESTRVDNNWFFKKK